MRTANDKTGNWLKKMYDLKRTIKKDIILKVLENSLKSLDKILSFINGSTAS